MEELKPSTDNVEEPRPSEDNIEEPRPSEDPPADQQPDPEITGNTRDIEQNDVEQNDVEQNDIFQDEPEPTPSSSKDPEEGDPLKCDFSPATNLILVILNSIAAGLLGYLIWYAVDQANATSSPTGVPTPSPTPPPTLPIPPTISAAPSLPTASLPTTSAPTSSPTTPLPTPIASNSPTNGPFTCNLCGEGKAMTITTGTVPFGGRLTRTCQELLTDQTNGDILENSCVALYDDIVDVCGCRPTTLPTTRTDAVISNLLLDKVGSDIDTSNTPENLARTFMLNSAQDTYLSTSQQYSTDDEIIQRYLVILALYKMNLSSLVVGSAWECA